MYVKAFARKCLSHGCADLAREVGLQFSDAATPVCSRLLADEFDVEERSLSGTVQVTGCSSTHDTWRHIRYQVLQRHRLDEYIIYRLRNNQGWIIHLLSVLL